MEQYFANKTKQQIWSEYCTKERKAAKKVLLTVGYTCHAMLCCLCCAEVRALVIEGKILKKVN